LDVLAPLEADQAAGLTCVRAVRHAIPQHYRANGPSKLDQRWIQKSKKAHKNRFLLTMADDARWVGRVEKGGQASQLDGTLHITIIAKRSRKCQSR
jgi:hypothetical protein